MRIGHRLAAAMLLCGSLTGAAPAAERLPLERAAPGVFLHYGRQELSSAANAGDIANAGIVIGSRCVAVIDTGGSAAVGQRLLEAVRRLTPLPVCYVINTHGHPDHVFGNAAFRGEPAEFVGHARLADALRRRGPSYLTALRRDLGAASDGTELVLPSLAVDDEKRLDLGDRTLVVQAWPSAHTDQDLTVFDQESGTLWLGDLLFIGHLPVVDGSLRGWLTVMDRLQQIDAVRAVPGHGRSTAWPQDLHPQRRYLQQLALGVRSALRARRSLAQALDELPAPQDGWLLTPFFHRRNVTAAFAELEWEE